MFKDSKNLEMLSRQNVYTPVELASRYEILNDNYIKTIQVEGLTAIKMLKTQIYPASTKYLAKISNEITSALQAGIEIDYLKNMLSIYLH